MEVEYDAARRDVRVNNLVERDVFQADAVAVVSVSNNVATVARHDKFFDANYSVGIRHAAGETIFFGRESDACRNIFFCCRPPRPLV